MSTSRYRSSAISIHALRVEGDNERPDIAIRLPVISIHALRVEGDGRTSGRARPDEFYFYPRPPGGGRRRAVSHGRRCWIISIHALRVEGDPRFATSGSGSYRVFLSTPSGWRATAEAAEAEVIQLFLSTPSGWRATRAGGLDLRSIEISIHALRVEGDSKNGQSFRLFLRKREKNLPL